MSHLGVDFSSHGGSLEQARIDCWKALGVEYAIVQYSGLMPEHLDACMAGDLYAEAYVYLYFPRSPWNQTPEDRVLACLNMIGNRPMERIWLDVEEKGNSPAEVVAAIGRCVSLVEAAGKKAGIYTARWIWPSATGNSAAFSHLPLWHAEYRGTIQNPPPFDSFQPYGGWARPHIWQFAGTTQLCGHSVDLNNSEVPIGEEEAPIPPPEIEPDDLALAIYKANNDVILSLCLDQNHCVLGFDGRTEWKYKDENGAGHSFNPPIYLPLGAPK